MATSYQLITLFVKNQPIRFYQTNAPINTNQNFVQFDQTSFNDTAMYWQQQKPYFQKATYADKIVIMVHTQANVIGDPLPYPDLIVMDSDGNTIANLVDPAYIKGAQQIAGNTFYDPATGTTTQLNTYCWEFTFGQIWSDPMLRGSGLYYLQLRNYAIDPSIYAELKSEPILVYDSHPGTILLQGKNLVNRASQNWVVDGWDSAFYTPEAWVRVEGNPEKYEPKGIYVGYLQQEYQASMQRAQNYRSFTLNVGSVSQGVPPYMYEKASEIVLMDQFKVDYKPFIYDVEGTDGNIKKSWQSAGFGASQLGWATFPIREKYNSQNALVVTLPIPDVFLWWSPWHDPSVANPSPGLFMQYAIPRFSLINSGSAGVYPISGEAYVAYSQSDENAIIASIQADAIANGLTGTVYRDDVLASPTYGQIKYQQGIGETVTLANTIPVLYHWYGVGITGTTTPNDVVMQFGGYGSIQVIDWQDGSPYNAYQPADASVYTAEHANIGTGSILIIIFHNNNMIRAVFADSFNILLNDIPQGSMQPNLEHFNIDAGASYTTPAMLPTLASSTLLKAIKIGSTDITSFSDLFTFAFTQMKNIQVKNNKLSSAAVDDVFNGFVTNSPASLSGGGTIDTSLQTPLAPPTAASATARAALVAAGWTIHTD